MEVSSHHSPAHAMPSPEQRWTGRHRNESPLHFDRLGLLGFPTSSKCKGEGVSFRIPGDFGRDPDNYNHQESRKESGIIFTVREFIFRTSEEFSGLWNLQIVRGGIA